MLSSTFLPSSFCSSARADRPLSRFLLAEPHLLGSLHPISSRLVPFHPQRDPSPFLLKLVPKLDADPSSRLRTDMLPSARCHPFSLLLRLFLFTLATPRGPRTRLRAGGNRRRAVPRQGASHRAGGDGQGNLWV